MKQFTGGREGHIIASYNLLKTKKKVITQYFLYVLWIRRTLLIFNFNGHWGRRYSCLFDITSFQPKMLVPQYHQ